ncbi:MAG: hypothetical protein H7833_04015 [Magnetococcus sp. DMHC-1]|nr:type III PLP-dependent enzyme [Magnetococcales bacterium]
MHAAHSNNIGNSFPGPVAGEKLFPATDLVWGGGQTLVERLVTDPPSGALYCLNLQVLSELVHSALKTLPTPYYAVKANSHPCTLKEMARLGLNRFDIASLDELTAVQALLPDATCAFMNPIKSVQEIRAAHHLGVNAFALDSMAEMERLLKALPERSRCTFLVRIAVNQADAAYNMSGKFGATREESVALLRQLAAHGVATGITFHVGSQCLDPSAYDKAITEASRILKAAATPLTVLDVGGGFPARHRHHLSHLEWYGLAIRKALDRHRDTFGPSLTVQSEPGRCLVAHAGSVAVQIKARKHNLLVLSDGRHGLLSDLWWMHGLHPMRRILRHTSHPHNRTTTDNPYSLFQLAGPTCDSHDFFPGPYSLPHDMTEGDWLEIGCLGAYCLELATRFNGYGSYQFMTVTPPNDHDHPADPENI